MRSLILLYEPATRVRTDYRVGLSAWTDTSMLKDGHFYPRKTMTAEERLWWYSRYFDVVEVNSSFYAIPAADTTKLWVERSPPGFLFNVKAYALLTGHHVDAARIPDALKTLLPTAVRKQRRVASSEFPSEARSWAFSELRKALKPLEDAAKLGYALFQLAPWVKLPMKHSPSLVAYRATCRGWSSPSNFGIGRGLATGPMIRCSSFATMG